MTVLTNEILDKSSDARFKETANFKHKQFIISVEPKPELGLVKNAELIDVQPYSIKPFTAKAEFRIDRQAGGIPFNEKAPNRRYMTRHVLIRQVTAKDIIERFGVGGVVYLGLGQSVPETTSGLAARFKELFGLDMVAGDIEDQVIISGATCILIRFQPKSVGFTGSLRVDLTTPITNPEIA